MSVKRKSITERIGHIFLLNLKGRGYTVFSGNGREWRENDLGLESPDVPRGFLTMVSRFSDFFGPNRPPFSMQMGDDGNSCPVVAYGVYVRSPDDKGRTGLRFVHALVLPKDISVFQAVLSILRTLSQAGIAGVCATVGRVAVEDTDVLTCLASMSNAVESAIVDTLVNPSRENEGEEQSRSVPGISHDGAGCGPLAWLSQAWLHRHATPPWEVFDVAGTDGTVYSVCSDLPPSHVVSGIALLERCVPFVEAELHGISVGGMRDAPDALLGKAEPTLGGMGARGSFSHRRQSVPPTSWGTDKECGPHAFSARPRVPATYLRNARGEPQGRLDDDLAVERAHSPSSTSAVSFSEVPETVEKERRQSGSIHGEALDCGTTAPGDGQSDSGSGAEHGSGKAIEEMARQLADVHELLLSQRYESNPVESRAVAERCGATDHTTRSSARVGGERTMETDSDSGRETEGEGNAAIHIEGRRAIAGLRDVARHIRLMPHDLASPRSTEFRALPTPYVSSRPFTRPGRGLMHLAAPVRVLVSATLGVVGGLVLSGLIPGSIGGVVLSLAALLTVLGPVASHILPTRIRGAGKQTTEASHEGETSGPGSRRPQ